MLKVKKYLSLLMVTILMILSVVPAQAASNPYAKYYDPGNTLNCTWYAWQRAFDVTGVALPGYRGNAKGWYQGAIGTGYIVNDIPAAHTIAVWSGGQYGHVAFVESVNGDEVSISEGGFGSDIHRAVLGKSAMKNRGRTIGNLMGYIHVKGKPQNNSTGNGGSGTNPKNSEIEQVVFDADFYLRKYRDLEQAFGNNRDALYNHWINWGIKEGRCASPVLDLQFYLSHNDDLKRSFGNDYTKAYNHFITYGYKEYRNSSPIYNASYYKNNNTDLQGMSSKDLMFHFLNYGMREGRITSDNFNVHVYRDLNSDLQQVYGGDMKEYFLHYMCYGMDEKRNTIDKEAPKISNIRITDVTKDGYRITCDVSDNTGVAEVKFPSWSEKESEALWQSGTISGNTATYYVKVTDHKNYGGKYYTHIYADDKYGNESKAEAPGVIIDIDPPHITDVEIKDQSAEGYTVTCKVSDDGSGIDQVQFPTWTEFNDQDDIFSQWDVNPKASGSLKDGKVEYRVDIRDHNMEQGKYYTDIYAFDKAGNETAYRVITVIDSNVPSNVPSPEKISISIKEKKVTLAVGDRYQITEKSGSEVKWTSSKPGVVSVDSKGQITALKTGNARIYAESKDTKVSCAVSIKPQAAKIKIKGSRRIVKIGKNLKLKVITTPSNAYVKTVIWTSSDPEIATVNSKGLVTGKKRNGKAITITAVSSNGKKAFYKVLVR